MVAGLPRPGGRRLGPPCEFGQTRGASSTDALFLRISGREVLQIRTQSRISGLPFNIPPFFNKTEPSSAKYYRPITSSDEIQRSLEIRSLACLNGDAFMHLASLGASP